MFSLRLNALLNWENEAEDHMLHRTENTTPTDLGLSLTPLVLV